MQQDRDPLAFTDALDYELDELDNAEPDRLRESGKDPPYEGAGRMFDAEMFAAASSRVASASRRACCAYALMLAVIGGFVALSLTGNGNALSGNLCYYAAEFLAAGGAVLRAVRAVRRREEPWAWALLALGLVLWCVGDLYWQLEFKNAPSQPEVSLADAFYLSFYPLAWASATLLMRSRVQINSLTVWLDGAISSLAIGSLVAFAILSTVLSGTGGSALADTVNAAYPVADLLLVAFAVAVIAMRGWRLEATWLWLLAGFLVFALGDSIYLYQSSTGTYVDGGLLDACWPLALVFISFAFWQRKPARATVSEQRHGILLPTALGALALAIQVYDHFHRVHAVAMWMSAGTLALILVRFVLTFRISQQLLEHREEQAMTDSVTQIPNRRAMMADLERALKATGSSARILVALFDLDGFKDYNDTFGHPAGDLLLGRLAARLDQVASGVGGRAYRMGGDEFCLLVTLKGKDTGEGLMQSASAALTEQSEAFTVGASGGHTVLSPGEMTVSEALRTADHRMYQVKHSSRRSAFLQTKDVLLTVLAARAPELAERAKMVARCSERVAVALGLPREQVLQIRHAAQLHDIGKLAVPDEVLHKRGPLSDEDELWLERHPLMGERIALAAPALMPVAKLIRSTHEHWDGSGHPDGLSGDAIPLGSQVVAVCDAFCEVACCGRGRTNNTEEALWELQRRAGTHFSPQVVDAFMADYNAPSSDSSRQRPAAAKPA